MIIDNTVGALVSQSIFQQYANSGGIIDVQAIIDSLAVTVFRPVEFTGKTDEEGWQQLGIVAFNNGSSLVGITALDINISTTSEGVDIENAADLTSITFSNLISTTNGGYIEVDGCNNLLTIDLSKFNSCANAIKIRNNTSLTNLNFDTLVTSNGITISGNTSIVTLSLPVLAGVSAASLFQNNTSLTTFTAPSWMPANGQSVDFSGCALLAASINHILARCVAAGLTNTSIDLSGGTNAAPTGQGITDAAALTLAGCTVTTN